MKDYEQQQEILSLKSDIKLMNQILKDWMKKFFNYSGLSKDEPQ